MGNSIDRNLSSCTFGTIAKHLKVLESVIWDVMSLKVFIKVKFYKFLRDKSKLPVVHKLC